MMPRAPAAGLSFLGTTPAPEEPQVRKVRGGGAIGIVNMAVRPPTFLREREGKASRAARGPPGDILDWGLDPRDLRSPGPSPFSRGPLGPWPVRIWNWDSLLPLPEYRRSGGDTALRTHPAG